MSSTSVNRLASPIPVARPRMARALVGVLTALVAALVAPMTAHAAPGTPGVPQAAKLILAEDFDNAPNPSQILVDAYTGAAPLAMTYTADPAWLSPGQCNGIVTSANSTNISPNCGSGGEAQIKNLASALGTFAGATSPSDNHALSAWTLNVNTGTDSVELKTSKPIPLATGSGRFISSRSTPRR